MLTHDELKKKILSNPDVKAEYDFLEEEFSLFDELLKARMNAGLTQAEVAERMGTKTVLSQALVKAKSALSSEPLIVTVIRLISCCLSAVMKTLQRPFSSKQLTIMAFLIRSLWIKVGQTSRVKRFKSHHRFGYFFDKSMVLFDNIIQIFNLTYVDHSGKPSQN
jgi:hypothetical protein